MKHGRKGEGRANKLCYETKEDVHDVLKRGDGLLAGAAVVEPDLHGRGVVIDGDAEPSEKSLPSSRKERENEE